MRLIVKAKYGGNPAFTRVSMAYRASSNPQVKAFSVPIASRAQSYTAGSRFEAPTSSTETIALK